MSWRIKGRGMEMCSCKMLCPCWLGPDGEPDQGWCGAAFAYEITEGESGGVDLGGTRAATMVHWPANFFQGQGTARMYLDSGASGDQARELEAILGGQKDGHLKGLWGAVITEWLPARTADISIDWGDTPSVTLSGVGNIVLNPLTNGAGQATVVSGAMAQAGFQIESMQIANPGENQWSDPDMTDWKAADGVLFDMNWSG